MEEYMAQNFKPMNAKHCYACIQWDGQRALDHEKKVIKVDDKKAETCRILHKKVKGDGYCEKFFPIR